MVYPFKSAPILTYMSALCYFILICFFQEGQKYYVLCILTDGIINDMVRGNDNVSPGLHMVYA